MKILKSIIFLSIKLNLIIGLSIVSLSLLTHLYFQLSINYTILFFEFFATIVGYSFVQYFLVYPSLLKFKWFKIVVLGNVFSLFFLSYLFFKLSLSFQIIFFILGLFLIIYIIPIAKNKLIIRKISGFKIFYVAMFITFVTAILPFNEEFKNLYFWFLVQRFLIVFLLIIPFEIQTIKTDDINLNTFPQVFGIKKSKLVGLLLVFISTLIELFLMPYIRIWALFFYLILGFFIWFSNPKRSIFYTGFWVEILPFFWLLAEYIKKNY